MGWLAFGMGFFLNHSMVIGSFNTSIADLFLVLIFADLVISQRFRMPRYAMIFTLLLLATSILTSLFITPLVFDVVPAYSSTIAGVLKLLISGAYFATGYSLAESGLMAKVLSGFVWGAFFAGIVGLVSLAVSIPPIEEVLYYTGIRYRGFMSDPNFFAILGCTAIVLSGGFLSKHPLRWFLVIAVLVVSVLLSGSKTGLLATLVALFLVVAERGNRTSKAQFATFATLIVALLVLSRERILTSLADVVSRWSEDFPQLQRLSVLLSDDPLQGLTEGGSGREEVWQNALSILARNPLVGVGSGSYLSVSLSEFGYTMLAHNTYLQMAVEWGLLFALLFFAWLGGLLVQSTLLAQDSDRDTLLPLRNAIIILLIGSLSLSLNNARMFWVFLAFLACVIGHAASKKALRAPEEGASAPQPELQQGIAGGSTKI